MDFCNAARSRKLHRWTIVILLISLALGLNQLASRIDLNFDLTKEGRYTLSQETLAWLAKLEKPVDIIITIRESNNQPKIIQRLLLDLDLLLDAFERAPSSFPIHIHRVDVNARKAQKTLIEKYNLAASRQWRRRMPSVGGSRLQPQGTGILVRTNKPGSYTKVVCEVVSKSWAV